MIVFSSKRTLNAYVKDFASRGGGFLPRLMVVNELFSKLILVKGKKRANSYESLMLMHKACVECEAFSKLGLSGEFFSFLKNKEYLFSFFKELAFFKKDIKDIEKEDIYAFYDEHLSILEEVLNLYKQNLEQNNLYDDITLGDYEINRAVLGDEKLIEFHLEGNLNPFELDFFKRLSQFCEVKIKFFVSDYNKNALCKVLGGEFLAGHHYEIDTKEILSSYKNEKLMPKIYLKTFTNDYLQAFWVYEKISHLVSLGINPQKIAVITPDESKTKLLRLLDFKGMLNYASGLSIVTTRFYKNYILFLQKELEYSKNKDVFTLNGIYLDNLTNEILAKYNELKAKSCVRFTEFCEFIELLLENECEELKYHIKTELESFSVIFNYLELNLLGLLDFFHQSIKNISISHVGGGEVSVYGLLESRGMSFDGVIVVDFNDDVVPKRSINELFLSNVVRKKSGLISYEDRENLQRHYYYGLFLRAKHVFISAIDDDEKIPSRFLKKLNYELDNDYNEQDYEKLFDFGELDINTKPLKIGVLKHNFFEYSLSYSRLKAFVTNRQKYYLRYVLGINEPRALEDKLDFASVGTLLHNSLEKYYEDKKNYFDKDEFLKCFFEVCKATFYDEATSKQTKFSIFDYINKLDYELLNLELDEFSKIENERFKSGVKILDVEKEFQDFELKNFVCLNGDKVKIKGRVDRIDLVDNKPYIIDYKYSTSNAHPLEQLVFYSLFYDDMPDFAFYMLKRFVYLDSKNDEKQIIQALQNIEKWIKDIIAFGDEIDFDGEFVDEKGRGYFKDYEDYLSFIIHKGVDDAEEE